MEKYDIKGELISIAKCKNCGVEVNADCFSEIYKSGIILSEDICIYNSATLELNELDIIDKLSVCCKKPDYYFNR